MAEVIKPQTGAWGDLYCIFPGFPGQRLLGCGTFCLWQLSKNGSRYYIKKILCCPAILTYHLKRLMPSHASYEIL